MKRLRWFFHLVMFSAMLALFACGGGGGGGDDAPTGEGDNPPAVTPPEGGDGDGGDGGGNTPGDSALYSPGQETILKTAIIDDNGGVIDISGTGTWLDGVSVSFPAGALPEATTVSIGYDNGTLTPPEGVEFAGPARTLVVHVEGVTNFDQMVEITVPYEGNADVVPTPFYVDDTGRLHAVLVKSVDTERKTVSFLTAHASPFLTASRVKNDDPPVDTKFRPSADGFQIFNYGGSITNTRGECYGMSMFAEWYYVEKKQTNGSFFPKYMNKVGKNVDGKELSGQDVIATRSHTAIGQSFVLFDYYEPVLRTTDQYRWDSIVGVLRTNRRPVVIALTQYSPGSLYAEITQSLGKKHAVLAYGVDEAKGELFIYDPNAPNDDTKKIEYDVQNKKFYIYNNEYTWFYLSGSGTSNPYYMNERFENIFQDAERDFTSNNEAFIDIQSHQNGEIVATRTINLRGNIDSSEVLIERLDVFVGDDKVGSAVVDTSGDFNVTVSL
ncbi:MAG: hypothetical protein LBE85_09215, partial [Candidatus Accumulibacter sp.]|nr:hypothetical protein [Accumulibacter sp.]